MAGLTGLLQALLPGAVRIDTGGVEAASAGTGAYALALQIGSPVRLRLGGREHVLAPGAYVYAGSAYGPGGLRARLRRHFRRDKALHWHVDRLTVEAGFMRAFAVEGGSECAILALLAGSGRFRHPLPGFGSSDCAACPSHLLLWSEQAVERL